MLTRFMLLGSLLVLMAACAGPGFWMPGRTGMDWGTGSFDSVGEQIYFTGIDGRGNRIRYRGGPTAGMMMGGFLSCASCHGPDARGGRHVMHMDVMDAPDIRWSSLSGGGHEEDDHDDDGEHADEHAGEYDLETFRKAVVDGEHPDGEPLSRDMPRWQMGQESLELLQSFLLMLD